MLTAVGCGNEGAVPPGTREYDVTRLVAYQEGAGNDRNCTRRVRVTIGTAPEMSTMLMLSERWFTTQTSLLVRAATETGSIPTGTESAKLSPTARDVENLEGVVRRVNGEQLRSIRRQCDGTHVTTLELDKGK